MDFLDEDCFEDDVEEEKQQIKEGTLKGAVLSKEVKNGEDGQSSFLDQLRSEAKNDEIESKQDMLNILDFEKKGNQKTAINENLR